MKMILSVLAVVSEQLSVAALALTLLCASTTNSRADCQCAADCTKCVGCPARYSTPLATCDKCYGSSTDQGKLVCTFTGRLDVSMLGPRSEGQDPAPKPFILPGNRIELPGNRIELPGNRLELPGDRRRLGCVFGC
jgi:hypothetical protein